MADARHRSPRGSRRRTVTALAVGAVLVVGVPVGAVVVHAATASDCVWTTPPDTVGLPLDGVRVAVALQYAVGSRRVTVAGHQGRDTVDLVVLGASGGRAGHSDLVRVVRAPSGRGWLIATKACGR